MSVRSAALAHELSMAWLRNAFAGFLASCIGPGTVADPSSLSFAANRLSLRARLGGPFCAGV